MAVIVDKKVQANATALEFTKLYYEFIDKKRNLLSKLYMETAVLVWNGNPVTGNEEIQKYLEKLPASEHTLLSVDTQPIYEEAIQNQNTLLVVAAGTVKFDKKPSQPFCQNFLVTAVGTKWKVVSDCLRFQQAQ